MEPRVRIVLEVLRRDPRAALDDLADAAGISASRLQHVFSFDQGVPLRLAARNALLTKAETLLKNTQLSVKEVQASVGFESASGFCRAFKRRYGLSPREYRRFDNGIQQPLSALPNGRRGTKLGPWEETV
jgi:AraC-like DNA-binding protein